MPCSATPAASPSGRSCTPASETQRRAHLGRCPVEWGVGERVIHPHILCYLLPPRSFPIHLVPWNKTRHLLTIFAQHGITILLFIAPAGAIMRDRGWVGSIPAVLETQTMGSVE
jgi:hypothetical protein